ncbi:MAG: alginate export family protein [Candidatus Cloacimonetes bacterium]|nr:alginate export family protein [Candidatus Cloacimonadota bacterium]
MRRLLGTLAVSATILATSHAASPFTDVSSNHWAYDAVNTVVQSGLMKGYTGGMFKGGEKVSRYQMAIIVSRLHDKIATGGSANVSPDVMQAMDRLGEEFMDELDLIGARLTALENAFHEHVSTTDGATMSTDGFKFSGDTRVRTEFRNIDYAANSGFYDEDTQTLVRTNLNIDKSVDKADFHVQLQHSTTMGDATGAAGTQLELHEAYVNLHIGDSSSLKMGRQEVSRGNESLIGSVNWSNTPMSYDGFVFSSNTDSFDYKLWTLSVANNGNTFGALPVAGTVDTQLNGADAWWKDVFDGALHVHYYNRVDGDAAATAGDRLDTYGFDWTRTHNEWDFYVQYAKQGGNDGAAGSLVDYDGDMMNLKVMYDFDNGHKAGLEYTNYSGDDAGAVGASVNSNGAFEALYPTGHKFLGAADIFTQSNIEDITIHWTKKANERNTFGLAYHMFKLDNSNTAVGLNAANTAGFIAPTLTPGTTSFNDDLGTELDLFWKHTYSKNVDFKVGYAMFSAGDYFTANKAAGTVAPDSNFGWVSTSVKF